VQVRYTGPHMTDYAELWQEYRRRRNLLLFAFVGYIPAVALTEILTTWMFKTATPPFVVAFSWMAFYAVAGIRLQRFKCPRCSRLFFAKWWYHNMFARGCVHCGLPKYADPATQL
jgi:hypothetical protein